MTKYVVELEHKKAGEVIECETISICDTYDEAEKIVLNKLSYLSDEDLKMKYYIIGEITENDLTEKNDWSSYSRIEVVIEYREV